MFKPNCSVICRRMVLVATLLASGARSSAKPGDIIDLGTGDGSSSQAEGINNNGQVAGEIIFDDSSTAVGLYPGPGGTFQDLGSLDPSGATVHDLNNAGEIVGESGGVGSTRAFFDPGNGSPQDLGTLGGSQAFAYGINDSHVVVGTSAINTTDGQVHAFRDDLAGGAGMQDLGTLGGSNSAAKAINNSGAIVGWAGTTNDLYRRAFKISGLPGQSMFDLGSLGGTSSEAHDINSSGVVVGQSSTLGNAAVHAFRHSGIVGDSMQDMGTLGGYFSDALAVNDAGFAVGYSYLPGNASSDPAIWLPNNNIVDLQTWFEAVNPLEAAHWSLIQVNDINNAGMVVGWGINDAEFGPRAFLLDASQIPEPGSLAILLFGLPLYSRTFRLRCYRAAHD